MQRNGHRDDEYPSDEYTRHPLLPAGPRSPIPLPPASPEILASVAKEIEVMDVEIPELSAIVDAGMMDKVDTSLKTLDAGILDLGEPISSQLTSSYVPISAPMPLTLALLPSSSQGHYYFIPTSGTENQSDPIEEFENAQGYQLFPSLSELDRSFAISFQQSPPPLLPTTNLVIPSSPPTIPQVELSPKTPQGPFFQPSTSAYSQAGRPMTR